MGVRVIQRGTERRVGVFEGSKEEEERRRRKKKKKEERG